MVATTHCSLVPLSQVKVLFVPTEYSRKKNKTIYLLKRKLLRWTVVNKLLLYGSTNFMSIEPNYVQVGGMGQSNGTTAPPTANGQANSAPLSEVINQAFTKRY